MSGELVVKALDNVQPDAIESDHDQFAGHVALPEANTTKCCGGRLPVHAGGDWR